MSLIQSCINFIFLAVVYGLFLRWTTPTPMIQPYLHGGFILAIVCYFLSAKWLLSHFAYRFRSLCFSAALIIFGTFWSVGIVAITKFKSWVMSQQNSIDAYLFYGSSGTQFHGYADTVLCWQLFWPVSMIILVTNIFFKNSKFDHTINN